MTEAEPQDFPFERTSALHPCPHYARLREESALAAIRMPSGDTGQLVTRYEDVRSVLSDDRFSRAATMEDGAPRYGPAPQKFKTLLNMDDPEHSRVRRLVSREFTARRVAGLRPRIQEFTDRLLDEMAAVEAREVDLVKALAFPLPVLMICELLGVPFEDREQFAAWSDSFMSITAVSVEEILAAQRALYVYLAGLIKAKRENPGQDLLSALTQISDSDEGRLSEEELTFLGISLLLAGHETTANSIANGVTALLSHPDQLEILRKEPELMPGAVEELLRLFPPGDETLLRIALEDVEIDGQVVPAGHAVLPSLGSANRDERHFEQAEVFDVRRQQVDHMTFGQGAHYCLGSGLARAELQIVIETLIRRFPTLRLAVPLAEVPRHTGRLVHGVSRLPVAW
ncbi:cytochrome P450 [Kitasatospora sp. MMS16-BH015]|uniref:cytochrome P450 n=1 Tax=Kitasatospora sp. MMS16-BH015 TaxID=2018025 RepID=UPI000CA36925|nr:cytochrome P450 [Kitasatospora sp. MMS16-BH015]AUG78806.1 cytochrome P450 [Kitasatospora sp. MMS16-BH015]